MDCRSCFLLWQLDVVVHCTWLWMAVFCICRLNTRFVWHGSSADWWQSPAQHESTAASWSSAQLCRSSSWQQASKVSKKLKFMSFYKYCHICWYREFHRSCKVPKMKKKTIQACRSPDIGSWSWKSPDFLSWCDVVRSVCYVLHWLHREMSYVQLHCTAGVGRVIADAHVGLCVSVLRYRTSLSRHAATEPYHSTEPQQMSQQQQSTGRPLPNNTRPRRLPKVNNRDDETTPRYHHGNSRPATNDQ